jgi:alginate O-acetyltransferase complex protein AlgI
MIFLTYWFIVFLAGFLAVYWLAHPPLLRRLVLLAGCIVFHVHFAGPAGVIPIVFLALVTYFAALSQNRYACRFAIALCIAALLFYKYSAFLAEHLLTLVSPQLGHAAQAATHGLLPSAPPLAISFFTFEFVHYLYDVSRGQAPLKSPLQFSLFAIFWPSIVAGPVKRYQQFVPAMEEGTQNVEPPLVASGFLRVAIGAVKKFTADNCTAYLSRNLMFFATDTLSWRWYFLLILAMRIYLDFSGYSDMAIGFGRMAGIRLPENFNWPYLATSMTDFWSRWHMSLSSWIRDYVYIPLGGSRRGPLLRAANALVAFALCGLWHGAAWNFVFWGIYHGLGVVAVTAWQSVARPGIPDWVSRPAGWIATLLYVGIGWLFFFYPLNQAFVMTRQLFFAR